MLTCAPNLRDIGGIPAPDGQKIRSGKVIRAEAWTGIDESDRARLAQLAIRTVIDLRSERERNAAPGHWHDRPVELHAIAVSADPSAAAISMAALADRPDAIGARAFMLETYDRLPEACAAPVRSLFQLIATDRTPILVHCTAGKDRTGVVIALLLAAIGIGWHDILSDYLATAGRVASSTVAGSRFAIDRRLPVPLSDAAFGEIMAVRADYLAASFRAIEARFNGIVGYLQAIGIDAALRRSVEYRLLR